MRAIIIFKKSLNQHLRDRLGLALSILTAPFFVILYWMFFNEFHISYKVIINNKEVNDTLIPATPQYGERIVEALSNLNLPDGQPIFDISIIDDPIEFNQAIQNGTTVAGIIIPSKFSYAIINQSKEPSTITLTGDANQPPYHMIKTLLQQILNNFAHMESHHFSPIILKEKPLGLSHRRTSFELYVPGLMVFSVIMLVFSSSMAVAREIESGTLERLKMAPLSTLDLISGISALQLVQGLTSVLLTFVVAWMLGFRSAGSIFIAFLLAGIACFASIGIGMLVASLSRSSNRAFLISSAVMFMLVLFSGVIFPRPEVTLCHLGNYAIDLFDFLPTTHMGTGLDKLLTLGVSLKDVLYEIISLSILSILYFGIGIFIFNLSAISFYKGHSS